MKILSIGDIHGRDTWKYLTHGSPYEYDLWRVAVENGAPIVDDFWRDMPYMKYDKIIFVGDYVDSFDVENVVMKQNLEHIIHFAKGMGDKVVLLLGNHDIQYIVPNEICSGYRPEMRFDFGKIFGDDIELFKIAHEEVGEDGSKWLWTHAGVTSGWYDKVLITDMMKTKHRFRDIIDEHFKVPRGVAENINFAWHLKMSAIYNVDVHSGGYSMWAGPLWVRPYIMNYWPMEGYNQVMGHTPQSAIWIVESDDDGKDYAGFKHHYIDCLGTDLGIEDLGLVIEI